MDSVGDTKSECGGDLHAANRSDLPTSDDEFLSGTKLLALISSLSLANFFAGYDATCVATITPAITNDFHSLGDVSWYGVAYSLATCATILSYGKLYSFFPEKIVFGTATAIFVIGSVLCATAQSSPMFIVGRAVAGLGNGGILSGSNILLARLTPLDRRPIYLGIVGGVECFALAVAPLLAGVITTYSTWRVCFYISIPFGVVSAIAILWVVNIPATPDQSNISFRTKLKQLDLFGMALFIPSAVCLVLTLQWGGAVYPWSDAKIVALLSLMGFFTVAFIGQQYYCRATATIPTTLVKSRTTLLAVTYIFSTSASLYVFTYYTPFYYQAVKGTTTMGSGLRDLSRVLGLVVSLLVAGNVTTMMGYYNPAMILGSILMCLGGGLTTSFDADTSLAAIIVYQALFGIGCGFAFQQPYVATQRVLSSELIPAAVVLLTFMQFLGSIISLSVAQSVFLHTLGKKIGVEVPGLSVKAVEAAGALGWRAIVPAEDVPGVQRAYSDALRSVFYVGLGFACATIVGAVGMRWKSVKDGKAAKEVDEKNGG